MQKKTVFILVFLPWFALPLQAESLKQKHIFMNEIKYFELNQNREEALREHFQDHIYFRLCQAVHRTFQKFNSLQKFRSHVVGVSAEQLFADAAVTLDVLLWDDERYCFSADLKDDIWHEYLQRIERGVMPGFSEDTEPVMLTYVVMTGLEYVKFAKPQEHELFNIVECIGVLRGNAYAVYGQDGAICDEWKAVVTRPYRKMQLWMEKYFDTAYSLTEEIGSVVAPKTAKAKAGKKKPAKKSTAKRDAAPPTFPYKYYGEEEGIRRIDNMMQGLVRLGWIEPVDKADDFHRLFSGRPRACNVRWKAAGNVLYALTKALLEQDYMEHRSGVSASAIVKGQFGRKHDTRGLSADKQRLVKVLVDLLDVTKQARTGDFPAGGSDWE